MALLRELHNLPPMNLSSLSFLFIYLPLCLAAYYIVPKPLRTLALTLASAGFLALYQPRYIPLAAVSLIVDYFLVAAITLMSKKRFRISFLALCIMKNLAFVLYFAVNSNSESFTVPLGVFVYCVSGVDAAIEAFSGGEKSPPHPLNFAAYILFFPRLFAGPFLQYSKFSAEIQRLRFDTVCIFQGLSRLVTGVFKYYIIGGNLYLLAYTIQYMPSQDRSVLSVISLVVSFALALYYTLSGLSDAARGVANLFGFDLPQNFYYPYQSRGLTDFFERFQTTWGDFLNRTVYCNIKKLNKSKAADVAATLLVVCIWAMFLGFSVNSLIFGAWLGVFIVLEKYAYPGMHKKVPPLFLRLYMLLVIFCGFIVLAGGSAAQSASYFSGIAGLGGLPPFNGRILYILLSNGVLLIISCIMATNVVSLLVGLLRKNYPVFSRYALFAVDIAIIALYTVISLGGGQI